MNDKDPILVLGKRTPFARASKGAYKDIRPDDLLCRLLEIQQQSGLVPEDLLVGCAYPEGEQGYNMARMVALGTGFNCPGVTINRLCASSMEAAATAAARIKSGWGQSFLVAGVESMSRVQRGGYNFSKSEHILSKSPHAYVSMGETAEEVARRFPISRLQQEDFAARSHELAHKAFKSGFYNNQLFPHLIPTDEFVRYPADRAKMESLPPAFTANGIVTAATSSPLTDGATSAWVLSHNKARKNGISHGCRILGCSWSHVDPEVMGLGPAPATRKIFQDFKITPADLAVIEMNEAFAIQSLACISELGLPLDKVNAWGGALAIGHPLGASGLRLLMTVHDRLEMLGKPGALGLATLCVGGGQGMAMLLEYIKLD